MDALNHKLKAASLLETILALVITMLVFGIASMVYVNVLKSGITLSALTARQKLEVLAEETKRSKTFVSETVKEEGYTIEKSIEPYQGNTSLLKMELQVIDEQGKVLAEYKELLLLGD